MFRRLYSPGMYHGRGRRGVFFEGWYYKMVSAAQDQRWAVIPGVFHHPDAERAHSFVQVLDGMQHRVVYHRFPLEHFQASRSAFVIHIGENYFHSRGFSLHLSSEDQNIQGEVEFDQLRPWPITIFSPGVMGPYRFAPFLQTYHGILSLDHKIEGGLTIESKQIDFSGGRGYMEKDWGSTFPRAYIWMQSNHFPGRGVSLTASVATIPWFSSWFRGFLVGIIVDGILYRFTTYLGSQIELISVSDEHVVWTLLGNSKTGPGDHFPGYRLEITASRGEGGLLSSPELDGMTPRILESLKGVIEISLSGLDRDGHQQQIIYQGIGNCAGLEVAGSIGEIADISRLEES